MAQMTTTKPGSPASKPHAAPEPVKEQPAAALDDPASPFRRSGLELSIFGGPTDMFGAVYQLGSQTLGTALGEQTVSSTNAGRMDSTSTLGPQSANTSYLNSVTGLGFDAGGRLTCWFNDSFGVSLDYTFASNLGSLDATFSLPTTAGTSTYATSSIGAQTAASGSKAVTTTTGYTSRLFTSPFGTFTTSSNPFSQAASGVATPEGNSPVVRAQRSLSIPNMNVHFTASSPNGLSHSSYSGNDGAYLPGFSPAEDTFYTTAPILVRSPSATESVTVRYTADAAVGISTSESHALSMINLLSRTVLFDNHHVELSFLSGLTAPTVSYNRTSTLALTNNAGTGEATQKVEVTDTRTGAGSTGGLDTIQVSVAATNSVSASAMMFGPMIGLGARAALTPNILVYSNFGWSPIVAGFGSTANTTVRQEMVKSVATRLDDPALKESQGSTSTAVYDDTSTTGANDTPALMVNASGAATSANIGAQFILSDFLGVFIEAGMRTFSGNADFATTTAGLNGGVTLNF